MQKINKSNRFLVLCGTVIFLLLLAIAKISPHLSSKTFEKDLIPVFVSLLIASSVVYFLSVRNLRQNRACSLVLIILFGFGFRILFLFSTPILEDDFYRYFWDGAVLSSGINPYEHSPEKVAEDKGSEKFKELKRLHNDTLEKVNHPHIKTIYPPVAEFFFALSYKMLPVSLTMWRIILILFDLVTVALLLANLKKLGVPLQNSLIYLWNPLLVKEIFNSVHMDILAFPFVLGAILLFLYGRKRIWTLALSLAVGIKLWPVLLFGIFLKPLKEKRETALQSLVFIVMLLIIFLPTIAFKLDSTSGIVAYGKSWQNNSPFFTMILSGWGFILDLFGIHSGYAHTYSRVSVIVVLLFLKFYIVFANSSLGVYRKALLIIGCAFLLSPTQFPWYYTWLIPFLCVASSPGFLLLTALLPLYYFQYYFPPTAGETGIFSGIVVWIEFIPVWILLAWEWWRFRISRKTLVVHAGA